MPTTFPEMPATYILKSQSTGKFYIGSALHLDQRLAEHQRGHSPYTRDRGAMGFGLLRTLRNTARSSSARTPNEVLEIQPFRAAVDRRSLRIERLVTPYYGASGANSPVTLSSIQPMQTTRL